MKVRAGRYIHVQMYANVCVKADAMCAFESEEMFIMTTATPSKTLYSRGDTGYSTKRALLGCCLS